MKRSITTAFLTASLALTGALVVTASSVPEADAQTMRRGTKTKTTTTTKRTTTRKTTRSHSSRRSHGHPHHRSGVSIQLRYGSPYYYSHRTHHHGHYHGHSVYHRTYVYPRQTEVVVVEPEPGFVMPELDCPIRTDEVRVGMSQWCETARGNKHGPFIRWYDDGRVATEGEYEYDLKQGVWLEFHPNGAIRQEGAYQDGEQVGVWITWGSDGQELTVIDYDDDGS